MLKEWEFNREREKKSEMMRAGERLIVGELIWKKLFSHQ